MPRTKIISDEAVFRTVLRLLSEGGEKAVSFLTVGQAIGLAAPTLVQRFGNRDGMVRLSLISAWDRMITATETMLATLEAKGPQGVLKGLTSLAEEGNCLSVLLKDMRDPDVCARAQVWRAQVEAALAARINSKDQPQETAGLLFSAWQGQLLWKAAGGETYRLRDAIKRLT